MKARKHLVRCIGLAVSLLAVGALVVLVWYYFTDTSASLAARHGPPLKTVCVGPVGAGANVIYLHGIDLPEGLAQEHGNRRAMAQIADELGIRLALARSPDVCPRDRSRRCWPNASRAAVVAAWQRILADTSGCFSGRMPTAVVGFSNGGYFVGKLFQYCLLPEAAGLVAIGSAGAWRPGEVTDLSACSRLTQLIGTADMTRASAGEFVQRLREVNARARLVEYDGGHVLPPAAVKTALSAILVAPRR